MSVLLSDIGYLSSLGPWGSRVTSWMALSFFTVMKERMGRVRKEVRKKKRREEKIRNKKRKEEMKKKEREEKKKQKRLKGKRQEQRMKE